MAPPKVRFLTKIYHPNIGTLLTIFCCDNTLISLLFPRQTRQNLSRYPERYRSSSPDLYFKRLTVTGRLIDKWSPALQIRTVLLSVQALLSAPNPDDPLATDVAKHYKENEKDAQRVSREWTEQYASA